jgi:hypothetical protein
MLLEIAIALQSLTFSGLKVDGRFGDVREIIVSGLIFLGDSSLDQIALFVRIIG